MSVMQGVGLLVVSVVLLAALARLLRSERARAGATGRGEGPPPLTASGGDDALAAELVELARCGQKIEAIRRLRERTRCGLKEAKHAVEALERGEPSPIPLGAAPPPAAPEAGLAEVAALLREGKKIEAIKRYRELTGCDLATAKDYVDRR